MRRIVGLFLCGLLLQCMVPSAAHAWWEFIEELSGPGRFYGWDIQLRVFCKTDEIPRKDNERDQDKEIRTRNFVPGTIGILTSTCRPEEIKTTTDGTVQFKQRLAIDLGMRFLASDNDERFAKGERISLTMFHPSISMALLSKFDNWDILSLGFGGGAYWFSSREFDSFNGVFLEPARLEIHAPFNWRKETWSAAIPRVRVGYLVFPAGFNTALFAATADVPPRITRDWVYNLAVDFDLSPLLRKLAHNP
jgi:hypothetical protein